MKNCGLVILFILLFGGINAQTFLSHDLADNELKGDVSRVKIFYYNVVTKFDTTKPGDLVKMEILEFNEKGLLTQEKSFSSDGNLTTKIKYFYDKNNSLKKMLYVDGNGDITSTIKLNYLDSSNTLRVNMDIEVNGLYVDGYVNIIKSENLSSVGINALILGENSISYFDSSENKKISYIFKNNWKLKKIEIVYYNNKNEKIRKKVYSKNLNIFDDITYKYEYDSKGNWIKRIKYHNEIPKEICKREIEYSD